MFLIFDTETTGLQADRDRGEAVPDAHDAAGDVRALGQVFRELMNSQLLNDEL